MGLVELRTVKQISRPQKACKQIYDLLRHSFMYVYAINITRIWNVLKGHDHDYFQHAQSIQFF